VEQPSPAFAGLFFALGVYADVPKPARAPGGGIVKRAPQCPVYLIKYDENKKYHHNGCVIHSNMIRDYII
jgi:hypothetical protein